MHPPTTLPTIPPSGWHAPPRPPAAPPTRLKEGGQPKVDGLERCVRLGRREHEVLELEVAVHDPLAVQVVDDAGHLAEDVRRLLLTVVPT